MAKLSWQQNCNQVCQVKMPGVPVTSCIAIIEAVGNTEL